MFSYVVKEGCTNHGCQVAKATKLYKVANNICGLSVWKVLYVTLLSPRILRYLPMRAVRKVLSHIEYLENRLHGLDVTWQPVRGDLTVRL